MDEAAFLNKIQSEPKDDLTRQIYADWLEERGDDVSTVKAEMGRPATNRQWRRQALRFL